MHATASSPHKLLGKVVDYPNVGDTPPVVVRRLSRRLRQRHGFGLLLEPREGLRWHRAANLTKGLSLRGVPLWRHWQYLDLPPWLPPAFPWPPSLGPNWEKPDGYPAGLLPGRARNRSEDDTLAAAIGLGTLARRFSGKAWIEANSIWCDSPTLRYTPKSRAKK